MKCPTCGCEKFYIKDPDDEYEIYEFNTSEGKIVFEDSLNQNQVPQMAPDIETFCIQCSWHGKYNTLNS